MLEKHPDTMTDSEIYQKIDALVRTKTPESIFFDYKKELKFNNEKEKIELAKDISSFANTNGGCLLYGIDEDRHSIDSAPIPKGDYGIEKIKGELIDIENILGSIISPPLPELRIRQIPVENKVDKFVYLIWHPKSWMAPHMVSGFKNNRYYKRGNFKSEPMEEHEIDLLYQSRNLSNIKLRNFLNNIDYGLNYIDKSECYLKVIASPFYLSHHTKYFSYPDAYKLINPTHSIRDKISFLEGATFIGYNDFVIRAFFNGTISIGYNIDNFINYNYDNGDIIFNILYLDKFELIINYVTNVISYYYNQLHFYGPVIINLLLENSKNMYIYFDPIRWVQYLSSQDIRNHLYNDTKFEFSEIFPITDILSKPNFIKKKLIDRIKNGFGWYYDLNDDTRS